MPLWRWSIRETPSVVSLGDKWLEGRVDKNTVAIHQQSYSISKVVYKLLLRLAPSISTTVDVNESYVFFIVLFSCAQTAWHLHKCHTECAVVLLHVGCMYLPALALGEDDVIVIGLCALDERDAGRIFPVPHRLLEQCFVCSCGEQKP